IPTTARPSKATSPSQL
nr:immunoglobulin heavy chain junction region [Homo sapiens]